MSLKVKTIYDVPTQCAHSNVHKFSEMNGYNSEQKKILDEVMENKIKAATAHHKKKPDELSALIARNIESITKQSLQSGIVIMKNNDARDQFNKLVNG